MMWTKTGRNTLSAMLVVCVAMPLLGLAMPAVAQEASAEPAQPQDPTEDARARFEHAATLFQSERFALAAQEFEQVYEMMDGHPRQSLIAFNIGQCYAHLGENERARDWLQRYLADASADAPNRPQAETILAELQTRLDLNADDGSAEDDAPSTEPAPAATDTEGGGISPVGPIVMAVGGAAVIVGAVLGGLALAQRGDVSARCTEDRVCPPDAESDADAIVPLAAAADGLLFGGAAVAAVGLVLTLVLPADEEAPAVAVLCGPSGCVGSMEGRF